MNRERLSCGAVPVLMLALALASGCANPVLPDRNNPLDPGGTNYNYPGVQLLAGPQNNAVIHQDDVTFRWLGTGKATMFKNQMDDHGWTIWSSCDSARHQYLDDGNHLFMIDAKTDLGYTLSAPVRCYFTVDAAPEPSLITIPWRAQIDSGSFYVFTLSKKGVGPISCARLVLTYDPSVLQYTTTSTGWGWWATGGSVVKTDSSRPGVVDVTFRLLPPGTGTSGDKLAQITCVALRAITVDSLVFAPATYLCSIAGDTVALTARRGSVISVGK